MTNKTIKHPTMFRSRSRLKPEPATRYNNIYTHYLTFSGTWPVWPRISFVGWFHPDTSALLPVLVPLERCWPGGNATGAVDPATVGGSVEGAEVGL